MSFSSASFHSFQTEIDAAGPPPASQAPSHPTRYSSQFYKAPAESCHFLFYRGGKWSSELLIIWVCLLVVFICISLTQAERAHPGGEGQSMGPCPSPGPGIRLLLPSPRVSRLVSEKRELEAQLGRLREEAVAGRAARQEVKLGAARKACFYFKIWYLLHNAMV